jgi:hypothetical protein
LEKNYLKFIYPIIFVNDLENKVKLLELLIKNNNIYIYIAEKFKKAKWATNAINVKPSPKAVKGTNLDLN